MFEAKKSKFLASSYFLLNALIIDDRKSALL